MRFAGGVLAAVAAALALGAVVAPLGIGFLNLVVPLFGCSLGGAIAGRSLPLGKRGIVGFAVAFTVALPMLFLPLIGAQGMSGNESIAVLLVDYGGTAAVAFALMGAVGVGIAGLGGRQVVRTAVVFGCAGVLGGLLLALCLAGSQAGNRAGNQVLILIGSVAYIVLPAALGGTILARRLAAQEQARATVA